MAKMIDEHLARLRAHQNNISRYRRLLGTSLTEIERAFIERRLSEEHSSFQELAASTFPFTFSTPILRPEPATDRQA